MGHWIYCSVMIRTFVYAVALPFDSGIWEMALLPMFRSVLSIASSQQEEYIRTNS